MEWTAKWIWDCPGPCTDYNVAVEARKRFELASPERGEIAVTADSWYRLFVNGEWVADGPCRSYPEHYQYDVIDVSSFLRDGENDVTVLARYFGVGTFHQLPRRGGLLAQLYVVGATGDATRIATDESWEIMRVPALRQNTPKVSVQMEPYEWFDARVEGAADFGPAYEICDAGEGPWQDLNPRDVALLTRTPFVAKAMQGAVVVDSAWQGYSFPVGRLLYPGLIEANARVSRACALATCIEAPEAGEVRVVSQLLRVTVNGDCGNAGLFRVRKGRNLLLAVVSSYFSHWATDVALRFESSAPVALSNPLDGSMSAPWAFSTLPDCEHVGDDLNWQIANGIADDPVRRRIDEVLIDVQNRVTTVEQFRSEFPGRARTLQAETEVGDDPHWRFTARRVTADATDLVERPEAMLHDNGAYTTVRPCELGDVELALDFGEQNCGFYELDLIADDGVVVDLSGVEYLTPSGTIQHTNEYRNGMRYVCRCGVNRFLSLKRRSQRYLYITLRNQHAPVRIRQIRLIESTYPVHYAGEFTCSDPHLDRIWDISVRTLKLCMEDTFTDCPLYEQTLWVGDARNEAVYAFTAFGATDIARRCIMLAGQSLERYPIVGCQVPSAWDVLIPAWSFMWGISVWDYYSYSGDTEFLRRVWPWVVKNLKGAAELTDERGLVSGPFWNMFDWTPIDDRHCTVLHNSMFMVGAIDAAIRCGEALGEDDEIGRLSALRGGLVEAINALWDDARRAYPDSIHDDGSISRSNSQHTSFLSLLYDIVPEDKRADAFRNVVDPPSGMVRVGSPFAVMYLYEALERMGEDERILGDILANYLPMIELGATTVWETFSTGSHGWGEFPTRSHCHAWSAAPIHFLNRIVLGLRPTGVGGRTMDVSPHVARHTWARGASQSVHGPVAVRWRKDGGKLIIAATAPKGVELAYRSNPTHAGLAVEFNGRPV